MAKKTDIQAADINTDTIYDVLEDVPTWSLRKLATVTWEMTELNHGKDEDGHYKYTHDEMTARNRLIGAMFKRWVEQHEVGHVDEVEKMASRAFKDVITRFGINRIKDPARLESYLGWEFFVTTPEKTKERGYGAGWMIAHDAGPYNWGVSLGFEYGNEHAYAESYRGCDMLIVPV